MRARVRDDCAWSASLTLKLGEKERYPELLVIWERACEKGSVFGCYAASLAWTVKATEPGLETDVARGRALFPKACAARYMAACGAEARLVAQVRDTASYATARAQLVEACKLRDRESCYFLGLVELYGTFGPKQETAAAVRFWEACRVGQVDSCAALAYFNAVGLGFRKTLPRPESCRSSYATRCATNGRARQRKRPTVRPLRPKSLRQPGASQQAQNHTLFRFFSPVSSMLWIVLRTFSESLPTNKSSSAASGP